MRRATQWIREHPESNFRVRPSDQSYLARFPEPRIWGVCMVASGEGCYRQSSTYRFAANSGAAVVRKDEHLRTAMSVSAAYLQTSDVRDGGTQWRGPTVMRISLSSWATTEEDVERSLKAVLRIVSAGKPPRAYTPAV